MAWVVQRRAKPRWRALIAGRQRAPPLQCRSAPRCREVDHSGPPKSGTHDTDDCMSTDSSLLIVDELLSVKPFLMLNLLPSATAGTALETPQAFHTATLVIRAPRWAASRTTMLARGNS